MKVYLSQQATVSRLYEIYTREVKQHALAALAEHGFLGLDPRADAPGTYRALKAFWIAPDRPKFFPVYNGGMESTVFDSEPMVNLLQRAWHDMTHCILGADFSVLGETTVTEHQMQFLSPTSAKIMHADIVGLRLEYERTGQYVADQKAFVTQQVFGTY